MDANLSLWGIFLLMFMENIAKNHRSVRVDFKKERIGKHTERRIGKSGKIKTRQDWC